MASCEAHCGLEICHKHTSYIYLPDITALQALNELGSIMLAYGWQRNLAQRPLVLSVDNLVKCGETEAQTRCMGIISPYLELEKATVEP